MPLDARTDVFSAGIILHEMLTTEKLFRGDTEFALMEKVRKAEVPPPSNFNRRVTPELDAISLKALARDVADRYQSAAQLAADLDALIAGYRFDPKELRQFIRQLFRKEYAKDLEETQIALQSEPGMAIRPTPRPSAPRAATPPSGTPTDELPQITVEPAPPEPAAEGSGGDRHEADKPRGFWASLFGKRK
jgi:serine/threonine protein kinase